MKEYNTFDFYEEEEDYLNEMSQRGYQLKSINDGYYEFEKEEGRYFYRLAYVSQLSEEELDSWVEELSKQDIDIVFVDGIWAYFRSGNSFHIYNRDQKKEIYKAIKKKYRKSGYGFLMAALFFTAAGKVAGSALYVGSVIFAILGVHYIKLSGIYSEKEDEIHER